MWNSNKYAMFYNIMYNMRVLFQRKQIILVITKYIHLHFSWLPRKLIVWYDLHNLLTILTYIAVLVVPTGHSANNDIKHIVIFINWKFLNWTLEREWSDYQPLIILSCPQDNDSYIILLYCITVVYSDIWAHYDEF